MPELNYRYYCLDDAGQLHHGDEFRACSDEEAIAQIAAKYPGGKFELWQGQRLVSPGSFDTTSLMVAESRRSLAEAQRILSETSDIVRRSGNPQSGGDAR